MSRGDVHTRPAASGWENTVEGRESLTRLFPTLAEALVSGRALARGLAAHHVVHPDCVLAHTEDHGASPEYEANP